ncbi:MAG: glycoside hydrolase family 57 protein, partial [Thermodesulfovibrionales bacterium]
MVLHAHLPFTRCPEQEHCLEETWLFEAITESYIPLLNTFEDLLNDRVDFRITVSLSPTLIAMLDDSLLRARYAAYLDRLIALSADEIVRTRADIHLSPLSRMYHSLFLKVRHLYNNVYRRDLGAAFNSLAASGRVELITSTATHAYLPALLSEPSSVRAQLVTGADYFAAVFGSRPQGLWLPECGFAPEIDRQLGDAGISFFFLESHGLLNPAPSGEKSIYAPARTPSGAVAFARDVDSSRQVWSSAGGYPGDFDYRDFYRDIGFDLEFERLREYLPHGVRTFTGLKYYRITGQTNLKQPYLPEKAAAKADAHAHDFLKKKEAQAADLHRTMKARPCITAAYDAELFGHWWFEGPRWLRAFLTRASSASSMVGLITPSAYIAENPGIETVMPAMSSWGEKGYSATWIDSSNDWIYRHMIHASRRMSDLASQHSNA